MPVQQLKSVSDILEALKLTVASFGGSSPWWRGHGVETWQLVPWAHRIPIPRYETNVSMAFYHEARTRQSNLPPPENASAWLFLMQHYGLPTRLLDWTDSCLVAAYFAVSHKKLHGVPGALWALAPSNLNKQYSGRGNIFASGHQEVMKHLGKIIDLVEPDAENSEPTTLALTPEHVDLRMLVQCSKFTIHRDGTLLEAAQSAPMHLIKYIIPPDAKPKILEELDGLKINRASLFPDLQNLAKDIMTRAFGQV